jgi:hypothetical protein
LDRVSQYSEDTSFPTGLDDILEIEAEAAGVRLGVPDPLATDDIDNLAAAWFRKARSDSGRTTNAVNPEWLAQAYEMVMALAPSMEPTPTRWQTIAGIYDRIAKEASDDRP